MNRGDSDELKKRRNECIGVSDLAFLRSKNHMVNQ